MDRSIRNWIVYPFLLVFYTVLLYIPLTEQSFPPGDASHYLVLSYSSALTARTYPAIPLIFYGIRSLTPNVESAFGALEAFLAFLMASCAVATYWLCMEADIGKRFGLIVSLIVASQPLYLESVGWGAYAQLLGISLAILSLASLLRWYRAPSMRTILITAFLLGLLLGVHYPTFTFAIVALIAFVILARASLRATLKLIATTFLFALPSIIVIGGQLSDVAPEQIIASSLTDGLQYFALFPLRAKFAGIEYILLAIGIVSGPFMLLRFCGSVRARLRESLILIFSLGLGSLVIFLTTPIGIPDRWVYYTILSFSLLMGLGAEGMIRGVALALRDPRATRFVVRIPGLARHGDLLGFGIVILLLITTLPASYAHYSQSLAYYSQLTAPPELAQASAWLGQQLKPTESVLIATDSTAPTSTGWFVEARTNLSDDQIYATSGFLSVLQTSVFTFTSERQRAETAKTILDGNMILDAGDTKLLFNPALGYGTPSIQVENSGLDDPILWFSDAGTSISHTANSDSDSVMNSTMFNAPYRGSLSCTDSACIQSFGWDGLNATRVFQVDYNHDVIRGSYNIQPERTNFDGGNIPIYSAYGGSFSSISLTGSSLSKRIEVTITNSNGVTVVNPNGFVTDLSMGVASNFPVSVTSVPSNISALSEIMLTLPRTGMSSFSINMSITIHQQKMSPPRSYSASSLMRSDGITYVVIIANESSGSFTRFATDPAFEEVYAINEVTIFEFQGGV